jgi:hypothetical protein
LICLTSTVPAGVPSVSHKSALCNPATRKKSGKAASVFVVNVG